MQTVGNLIKELRRKEGYPLRKVAAFLGVDQAILSKIENGHRKITKEQALKLADFFNFDKKEMLIAFLSDRIIYEVGHENFAKEALKVAEEKLEYGVFKATDRSKIVKDIIKTLRKFTTIRTAWMYGSFSRKDDGPHSDVDLAIETDDGFSYFDLAEIQFQLENAINRKIDIGFIDALKPHIIKNVEPDLTLIYER